MAETVSKFFAKGMQQVKKIVVDVFKKHHTNKMLIIGETGSGKTSFVNLLCNCGTIQALGCKFDSNGLAQFRHFNDVKLEKAESRQMESKTSGAKLYDVELGKLKVGLIDTPGFGDSRGMKEDKENVKKIIAAIEEQEFINCVCLVINGRQARISATLKYVMSEITAILPKEIFNNLIVVFSNTSDPLDLNFDPGELNSFFGRELNNIFFIENPYCRFEKAKQKQAQLPIDTIARSLQKSFEDTAEVLDQMYTVMKDFKPVHTNHFITLYIKKQEVEKNVIMLLTAYDNKQMLEDTFEDAQKQVDAALNTKKLNKQFTCVRSVKTTVVISTEHHNTLCGVKGCYSNCHTPCYLDKSFDKEVFKLCRAMNGGEYCTECKHHYSKHYNNEVKFETRKEEKNFIDENMRKQFEEAQSQEERARILQAKLKAELEESKAERERLSEQLLLILDEFYELGINRNYTMLIENQLQVVETHIEGTVGSETTDLRKIKEELEKKLAVVNEALESI